MSMAAKKLPPKAESKSRDELTPFNFRMPQGVIDDLDAWLEELNRGRLLGRVTRSDLIRLILTRAIAEKPDLGK